MRTGEGALVLASASPRRSEILQVLGIEHEVRPSSLPEEPHEGETPRALASRLARSKAGAVAAELPGRWVLGGDTVVVLDGELMGKPADPEEAVRTLLRLSGREHEVVSALALVRGGSVLEGLRVTTVAFRPLREEEVRAYVATGESMDKAGGYGIQGRGGALVAWVRGDYSAVVGLPVSLLVELLERAGLPYRFGTG